MLALIDALKGALAGLTNWWTTHGTPDTDSTITDMGPSITPRYWRTRIGAGGATVESANSLAGPWTVEGGFTLDPGDTAANIAQTIAYAAAGLVNALTNGGSAATTTVNPANPDGGGSADFVTSGGSSSGGDLASDPEGEVVEWVDAAGERRLTFVRAVNPSGASFIDDAVAAASNAVLLQAVSGTLALNATPAPLDAQWRSVDDSAVLVFESATTASRGTLTIPAPQAGLFLADGETLDGTNGLVLAIIAAATDALKGLRCPDGTVAGSYLGGYRRGRGRHPPL